MYDAPNAVEELKQPRKHPTEEKVKAISDALVHFGLKRAQSNSPPGGHQGGAAFTEKDGHGLKMIRCRSVSCDIGTAMSSLLRLPASVH